MSNSRNRSQYVIFPCPHAHRRVDGSPVPSDFMAQGNILIIPSPEPGDSGDYICFSGDSNFTYSLLVQDPPTTSPVTSPATSPAPIDSGKLILGCRIVSEGICRLYQAGICNRPLASQKFDFELYTPY